VFAVYIVDFTAYDLFISWWDVALDFI